MSFDILIGALKIISTIAAGLFGALALVKKFKDEHDNVTKWGKIGLSGIVISSVIALSLNLLETSKARKDAIAARDKEEATAGLLKTILAEAQTTVDTEKASLKETAKLKTGLDETLEGQKESLHQQAVIVRAQSAAAASQLRGIQMQAQQMEELRRLYLAQYRLAGFEMSWQVQPAIAQRAAKLFEETNLPDKGYLSRAIKSADLGIKLGPDGRANLVMVLSRMEILTRAYKQDSPEWKAFVQA